MSGQIIVCELSRDGKFLCEARNGIVPAPDGNLVVTPTNIPRRNTIRGGSGHSVAEMSRVGHLEGNNRLSSVPNLAVVARVPQANLHRVCPAPGGPSDFIGLPNAPNGIRTRTGDLDLRLADVNGQRPFDPLDTIVGGHRHRLVASRVVHITDRQRVGQGIGARPVIQVGKFLDIGIPRKGGLGRLFDAADIHLPGDNVTNDRMRRLGGHHQRKVCHCGKRTEDQRHEHTKNFHHNSPKYFFPNQRLSPITKRVL